MISMIHEALDSDEARKSNVVGFEKLSYRDEFKIRPGHANPNTAFWNGLLTELNRLPQPIKKTAFNAIEEHSGSLWINPKKSSLIHIAKAFKFFEIIPLFEAIELQAEIPHLSSEKASATALRI